ncbi:reverse transcriptase domain-containing protein [Polaromonas sp. CT11-55]|uniref:reverse transcriptase domain-containing protein n=1 Tax=Polaromonas sp. CT11-55 TaxID=3243045 RepID=UPI0039A7537E
MSDFDTSFGRLYPQGRVLQDEVVLAQAWKKTHTFIRRHNWYADTLELDTSAVCLPSALAEWSTSISSGKFKTEPAWLVPAPKNGMWTFNSKSDGGWGPAVRDEQENLVMRPLAHIGIREQTVATAVMMCLADCIESAQGDTSLEPLQAASSGVYSYGNRLYCNWSSDHLIASFPWGNSNTYSRYFQDYQRFVQRPVALAAQAKALEAKGVFIVSLDLSAFFDNVNIELLINRLQDEYDDFSTANKERKQSNNAFWESARNALRFRWRDDDEDLASLLRDSKLPSGLPQGLVSSGFFANAYLLKFDRAVGRAIGKQIEGQTFIVHDYCRYVDDLRLVISTGTEQAVDEVELAQKISDWIQRLLKRNTTLVHAPEVYLKLNSEKTQLEQLSEVGGDSRTALRMKTLQRQLSGPFDMDALRHVEAGLNGLLSLAELGLIDETASRETESELRLASVAKTKLEVRDDTLTRFSAYRLTRSLRMRRSMTDLAELGEESSAKESLLHDFQAAARRLVAAWAVNPSLVQVLRYALDLFPSTELLEPVSQALLAKVRASNPAKEYERRVAYYVLADMFKAGATETGRTADDDPGFTVSDVGAYREGLAALAYEVLELPDVPWYVRQQASLLISTLGKHPPVGGSGQELRLHGALEAFVKAKRCDLGVSVDEELAVSLVGYLLLGDAAHYRTWFERFGSSLGRSEIVKAWIVIAENDPELFSSLISSKGKQIENLIAIAPRYLSRYWMARSSEVNTLPTDRWIPLIAVISRRMSHFSQENGLLKLAAKLADASTFSSLTPELFNPLNIEIRSNSWERLNDPRFDDFEVRPSPSSRVRDRVYETPSWCRGESAWLYAIGRLLRAAATGEPDFTARQWLFKEDTGWYVGLRSTWHKRRIGMSNTAEALRGTSAAITPWFSELLLALLRWPGVTNSDSSTAAGVKTRRDLVKHVQIREELQKQIFGKSSNLPIYRYPIEWPINRERGLRVAMVQGLMPQHRDFNPSVGLAGFDVAGYRERHRNHTAALLHLASKHLSVRDYVLGRSLKPQFDLVVFPELTIHVGDQDLMRAFSDATGAMLFYGLVGAKDPISKKYVNAARWLVPQRRSGRRSWVEVDQGKYYLTPEESELGISSWRPYQVVIELHAEDDPTRLPYRLTGSICYDATDLALAADLRNESHMYVVTAMNKDVKTFDGMVAALRYHMYQHVLIANIGEYGGSTAQAPYDKEHRRLISHTHGSEQLAISVFDIGIDDFGPKLLAAAPGVKVAMEVTERVGKAPPAGLNRQ